MISLYKTVPLRQSLIEVSLHSQRFEYVVFPRLLTVCAIADKAPAARYIPLVQVI